MDSQFHPACCTLCQIEISFFQRIEYEQQMEPGSRTIENIPSAAFTATASVTLAALFAFKEGTDV